MINFQVHVLMALTYRKYARWTRIKNACNIFIIFNPSYIGIPFWILLSKWLKESEKLQTQYILWSKLHLRDESKTWLFITHKIIFLKYFCNKLSQLPFPRPAISHTFFTGQQKNIKSAISINFDKRGHAKERKSTKCHWQFPVSYQQER